LAALTFHVASATASTCSRRHLRDGELRVQYIATWPVKSLSCAPAEYIYIS
jgi:hypothetical protein